MYKVIKKTLKKSLAFAPLLGLILIISTTDPQRMPAAILILPFILVFWCLVIAVRASLCLAYRLKLVKRVKYLNAIALPFALIITLALVMQSVQQLSLKDIVLLSILAAGLVFYLKRLFADNLV